MGFISKKMHINIINISTQKKKFEQTFSRLVRDNEIEDRYDKIPKRFAAPVSKAHILLKALLIIIMIKLFVFFHIFRINFNVEQNVMI